MLLKQSIYKTLDEALKNKKIVIFNNYKNEDNDHVKKWGTQNQYKKADIELGVDINEVYSTLCDNKLIIAKETDLNLSLQNIVDKFESLNNTILVIRAKNVPNLLQPLDKQFIIVDLDKITTNYTADKIKGLDTEVDNGNIVVKLTKKNAKLVKNVIKQDESYNVNFGQLIYLYYKFSNAGSFDKSDEKALQNLIRMIDLDNNTQVWRYLNKRQYIKNMVEYIVNPTNDFWTKLEQGNPALVDALVTQPKSTSTLTTGPKSLASKVCKFFSEYFYDKDYYYINDSVVRAVLPAYCAYYEINDNKINDKISYSDLYAILSSLHAKASNLTKSELDSILWYCYRNDNNISAE